jgi:hypothetical protein
MPCHLVSHVTGPASASRPRSASARAPPGAWVTRHPIGGSLLAGAVATQFATVFGIWFPGFGLPSLNWPVAKLFHPLIPIRNTLLGNLIKAFLYGTVLAVISAA